MKQNKPKILISPQCNENGEAYIEQEYIDFIEDCGGEAVLLPLDINEKELKNIIRKYDGILIPGGNDIDPRLYGQIEGLLTSADVPKRDKLEPALITLALNFDIPLLCICRGMQMLNVVCGGNLYQKLPKSSYNINHNQHKPYNIPCHTIKIESNTQLSNIIQTDIIYVNSIHHQGVNKLGHNLKICAKSIDGLTEGIYNENQSFCLGVQWHPELLKDNFSMKIGKYFVNKAKEWPDKKTSLNQK